MQVQVEDNTRGKILSIIHQRQYLEALDRYRAQLKAKPDELAVILVDLYRLLINDYSNLHIRLIICELCLQFNMYNDVLDELDEMIDIDKDFSQSYFLLAKLYNKNNDYARIEPLFKKAFDAGVRDSIVIDTLPKLYLDRNKVHAAKDFFEVLTKEPDVPLHYYKVLAELYKKIGHYEQCVDIYERLIEKAPQYTSDACTICENILQDYQSFSKLRKKLLQFYVKDCKPDLAISHLEAWSEASDVSSDDVIKQYQDVLSIFPSHTDAIFSFIYYLLSQKLFTDACDKLELLRQDFELHVDVIKHIVLSMKAEDEKHHYVTLFLIDVLIHEEDYVTAISYMMDILPNNQDMDMLLEIEKRCDAISAKKIVQQQLLSQCLAALYFNKRQYNLALSHCEQSSPDSVDVVILKSKILREQKQFSEAKQYLKQQFYKFPTKKALYEEMHHVHEAMLHDQSDNTGSENELLRSLMLKRHVDTIQVAQKIQSFEPHYVQAQLSLIRSFYELNKFDQALQISEHIVSYVRESHQELICPALYLKSLCHYNLFEFKKAYDCLYEIETYDIGFSFSKTFRDFLKNIPFTTGRGFAMTAIIQPWTESLSLTAIQNYDEKLALNRHDESASFGLNHNNQGIEFFMKQNAVSAEAEFNVSLQLDPSLVVTFSNLGLLKLMQDDFEQAEFYLQRAKEQNEQLDVIYLNIGLLRFKQGQYEQALDAFQTALKLNLDNCHAKYNIAMVHFELGRLSIAFQYLQKVASVGLFFMPLQRLFYFLDPSYQDLAYWNRPSADYGFEKQY